MWSEHDLTSRNHHHADVDPLAAVAEDDPVPAEEAGRFLAASFRKENSDRFGRSKTVLVA